MTKNWLKYCFYGSSLCCNNIINGMNAIKSIFNIVNRTTSEDIEVEIAGNENLKEGENVITLLVHNKKNDATATYQINAKVENQKIDLSTVNSEFKNAESNAKKQAWIIKGTIL